jgi:receptor-type tyrosine-protein phosphatase Q
MFQCHTAPTSAPVGLSVISQSSNSLTLAWMAPPLERQNGLITGYSVNVTNSDTGVSMHLSSTENSITVGQLSPYTSYQCSVAAQTIVGRGPYTSLITVTTNEDGKN